MTTFQKIEKALLLKEPRAYVPAFRIAREGEDVRLFDGDRALALFRQTNLDIWAFSPFEPDVMANPEPPGKVVDLHTVHNTYLNFGAHAWPAHWNGCALSWRWERESGETLVAVVALDAPEGERCRWRITVSYDPAQGRYRYQVAVDARKRDPAGFESFNMMLAGALEDRPEKRRWSHTLRGDADGQTRRIVHSNALFECTDFGNMRTGEGPWRHYHLGYPQAWVAYAAHPVFNPACLIRRTTVPLMGATCSQLFDEHIIWTRAGQDQVGEDGYFHFHLDLEFVNLPAPLAKRLLKQAADPAKPQGWMNERVAIPFHMEVENAFETAVDPWQPETCPILVVPAGPAGAITWADDQAHSGSRSIRLRQQKAERLSLFPLGAVCKVRARTRYRLSAWVKTEAAAGGARLELAGFAYTYRNISHQAASADLRGTTDWTRLEVELESGEQAYVMPFLVLDGPGTAWFDDVRLGPA